MAEYIFHPYFPPYFTLLKEKNDLIFGSLTETCCNVALQTCVRHIWPVSKNFDLFNIVLQYYRTERMMIIMNERDSYIIDNNVSLSILLTHMTSF